MGARRAPAQEGQHPPEAARPGTSARRALRSEGMPARVQVLASRTVRIHRCASLREFVITDIEN